MNYNNTKISVKVLEIKEELVILATEYGQKITWPKNQLPDNLKEGDFFYLIASKEDNTSFDPKKVLEEILNGEEEK